MAGRLRRLAKTGHPARGLSKELGGEGDFGASVTAFEMLGHADLSLLAMGVHWGLFGGAVANLGTARHHAAYLPQIVSNARVLRDDRDGPRLRRPCAGHHRHL